MGRCEWIAGSGQPLKTDFEHHGLGKAELDVTDPAYDLAETILSLDLSPAEENRLLGRYVAESEDTGIGERLFLNKLLAGLWTMNTAQARLFGKPHATARQEEYHRLYMSAWHFLTVQTARHCGSLIPTERAAQWRSPLVATDIDGVLDRRLFGFPSTSAAGLEALAVLASHRLTVALNSARSASEIREYCQAYSLAGGVAEYGSYLYDAVGQCEKVLVSPQALSQLAELRTHLQRLPGVFLDDRHQYSIRALTYVDRSAPANRGLIPSLLTSSRGFSVGNGIPAPLPALTVNHLLATLELDKLTHHHTTIDTTFVAKDVDKGTGLQALRDWVMGEDAEVFAIGDSQPDLAMFKVATRSFAPRNISCSREARLLGCSLSRFAYQRGLLDIARRLAHPDGGRCERCAGARVTPTDANSLFLDLLKASDATHVEHVLRPLFDPQTYCTLVR